MYLKLKEIKSKVKFLGSIIDLERDNKFRLLVATNGHSYLIRPELTKDLEIDKWYKFEVDNSGNVIIKIEK